MASPSLREQKKVKTRVALVQAAFELFLEQGFEATSVDAIAIRAEVSRRTFFRYFPSKEWVLFRSHHERLALLVAALERQVGRHRPFEGLYHALQEFGREYMAIKDTLLAEWRVVIGSPTLVGRDVELDQEYVDAVQGFLTDPSQPIRLKADRGHLYAAAVFGGLRAVVGEWFQGACREDLRDLGERRMKAWLVDREAGASPEDWDQV